jgi:endonuclease/exonuclease/phosphatase family metal-dependent hydrolase
MIASTSITLAGYNILNPYHAVKWGESAGLNDKAKLSLDEAKKSTASTDPNCWRQYSNWDQRCPFISKNIQLSSIVCLQEASIESLQQITPGYTLACSVFHSCDNPVQQHGNAIVFKDGQAKLLKAFEIKHSFGTWSRSAACAVFQVADKVLKVVSVHLSGYTPTEPDVLKKQKSKENGFNELKTYADAVEADLSGIDGIVICGDFNEDPTEAKAPLYRLGHLMERGYTFDGNLSVTEPAKSRRIDWLCFKQLDKKSSVNLVSMGLEVAAPAASDHLMTGTKIEWTSK